LSSFLFKMRGEGSRENGKTGAKLIGEGGSGGGAEKGDEGDGKRRLATGLSVNGGLGKRGSGEEQEGEGTGVWGQPSDVLDRWYLRRRDVAGTEEDSKRDLRRGGRRKKREG